jgi:FkbM family methyltransferase
LDQAVLRTSDHPFLLPAAQHQYQSRHKVREGEVVVDAGAFNGHLSLYFASQVGNAGRVIAIEADKSNLLQLSENLDLNPNLRHVSVVEAILWDRIESVEFCEQGSGASSAFWMPDGKARSRKQTTTLDNVVRDLNLSRLDFIKMDIEGAEVKALAGACETIDRFRPDFAIGSYHIADGEQTRPYVERILQDYRYDVETLFFGKECITFGTAPRG